MGYPAPRDGLGAAECVLEHVLGLLATPQRWQPVGLARDALGQSTAPDAPDAACWSLSGALARVAGAGIPGYDTLPLAIAKVALSSAVAGVAPPAAAACQFWEFEARLATTHADVLALLVEAIALLRRS